MTINNRDEYLDNIWDWAILKECFGSTKIEPTDIDGFVERNGKFLILETKAPGVEVKVGQMITFRRLIKTGYFTIILIWGEPGKPEKIALMTRQATFEYDPADLYKLRYIVSKWFEYCNKNPAKEFLRVTDI